MTPRLKELYFKKIQTSLKEKFAFKNVYMSPQLQKVVINITNKAKKWVAKKGYDPIFGARPMGRTIQKEIETILADEILFGKLESGGEVSIDLKKNQLTFKYS